MREVLMVVVRREKGRRQEILVIFDIFAFFLGFIRVRHPHGLGAPEPLARHPSAFSRGDTAFSREKESGLACNQGSRQWRR